MKTVTLFSVVILGCIFLLSGVGVAGDDKGAESIALQGGKMGMVTFPHGRHQGVFVNCKPCHDLFPKEPQIIEKMKEEGKLQKKAVMNMCKNCHKDLAEKDQKRGPTSCKGCHTK